ncbi:MAG TPA: lipoate--protein ligase family protein [Verrucomicrobiae bacterium]
MPRTSAALITRQLTPAEFLATEEALLDFCEDHTNHPGFLWFWESPNHFVVLGYGKHIAAEVNEPECQRRGIPILRRASGGGTVLQGPGCVNYTLILPMLPIDSRPELSSISSTNIYVMQQIHAALAPIVPGQLAIHGYTDLTIDSLKFSGNAQRRKKRSILFHGSFLLDFNLDLISQVLQEPAQQPEYRRHRPHRDFLRNLPVDRPTLTASIQHTWQATTQSTPETIHEITQRAANLITEKYSQDEWNRRF